MPVQKVNRRLTSFGTFHYCLDMELSNDIFQIAEVIVTYTPKIKASDRPKITKSSDCYAIFMQRWNSKTICFQEEFKILLLNRASHVLGIADISMGGMAGTVCDPKIVFSKALGGGASAIILAHNHPSGSLTPSHSDIALTSKLCGAGKFLDIDVFDHLIITPTEYFSFADQGLL